MAQINIKDELLDKIKKESRDTGIKIYKLIEISFNAYTNQDIRKDFQKETDKIKDKVVKSNESIVREEVRLVKESEIKKRKVLEEKIKNQKIQYNNLLKRLSSLKKK